MSAVQRWQSWLLLEAPGRRQAPLLAPGAAVSLGVPGFTKGPATPVSAAHPRGHLLPVSLSVPPFLSLARSASTGARPTLTLG